MASLDPAKFREQFPAFVDDVKYPDSMLQLYWDLATLFISDCESPYRTLNGAQLQAALNFLTAHLLFIGVVQPGMSGGGSGGSTQGGYTTSATVGEVSVTKLAPPASNGWQWWLAGSTYGQSLWALLSVLSVGGFSVGGLPERDGFRKVGGVFF